MKKLDLTKLGFNEKGFIISEELNDLNKKAVDHFVAWVFDCLPDSGLIINLQNLKSDYLSIYNQLINSK